METKPLETFLHGTDNKIEFIRKNSVAVFCAVADNIEPGDRFLKLAILTTERLFDFIELRASQIKEE